MPILFRQNYGRPVPSNTTALCTSRLKSRHPCASHAHDAHILASTWAISHLILLRSGGSLTDTSRKWGICTFIRLSRRYLAPSTSHKNLRQCSIANDRVATLLIVVKFPPRAPAAMSAYLCH